MEAIPVGVDLEPVWKQFDIWTIMDETYGIVNLTKDDETKAICNDVVGLINISIERPVTEEEYKKVADRADRAYWADLAALAALADLAALAARADLADLADFYKAAAAKLIELLKLAK